MVLQEDRESRARTSAQVEEVEVHEIVEVEL